MRLDAKLEPMGKQLHCNAYNSLLKAQRGDYEPLFRSKVTIDNDTDKSLLRSAAHASATRCRERRATRCRERRAT